MELLILNSNLETIDTLDIFESLIWTDRFAAHGDFEYYDRPSEKLLNLLRPNTYIWSSDSDHLMIVEKRQLIDDGEDGTSIVIRGRSLESILTRRIVWQQTVLSGSLQNGVELLLNDNVINPILPERRIDNFIFEASDDPNILGLTIDAQYTYTDLYETIKGICESAEIGFKITLSDDNKFVFKLYSGKDRSYSQIENPYVVFSPNFDNLLQGDYSESEESYKNVTLIAGEGDGESRIRVVLGNTSGLTRRELYTDARDISTTVNSVPLTTEEYTAELVNRGLENLIKNQSVISFEGKADTASMFLFGRDFFLGDTVQFENEYGVEAKARVTEIIRSQSTSGIDIYPTFTIL